MSELLRTGSPLHLMGVLIAIPLQARHDGQNYVFSLLTGYREPPAGVHVRSTPRPLLLDLKCLYMWSDFQECMGLQFLPKKASF
jgi:hypothetical protein